MQRSMKAVATQWARIAAAASVGAMMTLGVSAVALADPAEPERARAGAERLAGNNGVIINAKADSGDPGFFIKVRRLSLTFEGGQKALAYCVELSHHLAVGKPYTETGWEESGLRNLGKVQWILAHAYPSASVDALAEAAGATKPTGFSESDLKDLAYTATQAAVWSYTDADHFALAIVDAEATKKKIQKVGAMADDSFERWFRGYQFVISIYNYLNGNAKDEKEPATLAIDPASAKGNVGGKAGPFTVKSSVGDVDLTATGGALVDKDGKAVSKLKSGQTFYVDCKAEGTVKIEAKAKFSVPIGRVFSFKKKGASEQEIAEVETFTRTHKSPQKLILAGHAGKELTASAEATCVTAPGLPVTGAPVAGTVAAGMVLLATGAGLFLVRRRRIRFTA